VKTLVSLQVSYFLSDFGSTVYQMRITNIRRSWEVHTWLSLSMHTSVSVIISSKGMSSRCARMYEKCRYVSAQISHRHHRHHRTELQTYFISSCHRNWTVWDCEQNAENRH